MTVASKAVQQLIALVFLTSLSQLAIAQRYGFLGEGVLHDFTSEDVAAFREFVRNGLDAVPDMQVIDWESPSGRKSGRLLPRFTYQSKGSTCRRAAFQVSGERDRAENFRFDLCRESGGWVVVEAPANLNGTDRRELEQFVDTVIENGEQGVSSTWISSRSGHQAVIVPLTMTPADVDCRDAAVTLIDRSGNSIGGQYLFCRDDVSGFWEYSRQSP